MRDRLGLLPERLPVNPQLITSMWDAASTTAALSDAYASIGVIFGVAIAAILGAWAALHGLGYGIRKAKKHAVGKAF